QFVAFSRLNSNIEGSNSAWLAVNLEEALLDRQAAGHLHHRADHPPEQVLGPPVEALGDPAAVSVWLDAKLGRAARFVDLAVGDHRADHRVRPLVGHAFPHAQAEGRGALGDAAVVAPTSWTW